MFEFPSLARGAAFILDPEGSGSLVPLPSGVERAQAYADAAKAAIAAAHRALNTTMSVIEGSGSGKWAVREGWAGEEWGLEGLGRAWKVREVLGGKYRSFHAPDEQVFYDLAEARHYGQNLSRLERMDYRFRRVTRFGGSDASFASIDLANQRAVFSRPDSIYGHADRSAGGLGGVGGDGAHAAPEEQAPVALAPLPPGWAPDEGAMEKLSGMVCAGLATLGNSSSRVVGHVLAPAQHGLVRSGGDGVGGQGAEGAEGAAGDECRRLPVRPRGAEAADVAGGGEEAATAVGAAARVAQVALRVLNASDVAQDLAADGNGRQLLFQVARFGLPDLSCVVAARAEGAAPGGGEPHPDDGAIDLLSPAEEAHVACVRQCRARLWRFLLALPPADASPADLADDDSPAGAPARPRGDTLHARDARQARRKAQPGEACQGARVSTRQERKAKRRRRRAREQERARRWWRQSQRLSLLAAPSAQMRAWEMTHERLVLALCHLVDHEPWQLRDDYPDGDSEDQRCTLCGPAMLCPHQVPPTACCCGVRRPCPAARPCHARRALRV